MTRFYRVNFAHKTYGPNYSSRKVAIKNGWAIKAIIAAKKLERDFGGEKQLIVESVEYLGEGE